MVTIFVFDPVDTSLVTFAIGAFGSFEIENVPSGEYIIYLDDQLGNLIGTANYLGQYYSGASTPGAATRLKVKAGEAKKGINFVLEPGGSISGAIKSEDGQLLGGVWIMAIDATLKELKLEPWLSNLHLFIGQADAQGKYKISGLPTGSYMLRTISRLAHQRQRIGPDQYHFRRPRGESGG